MWNNSSITNTTSLAGRPRVIQQALGVTLAVMLGLVIFSLGCSVKVGKVWINLKRPWGILTGLLCQLGAMPLTAYLLALAFSVQPVQAVAIIIVGSCPGGALSNIITYWLEGDMDLSITLTTMSTLLGLGTLPLNLYIYSHTWVSEGKMEIPYLNIGLACISLIVPVSCGMLVNYKWPKVAQVLVKVGTIIGGLVMLGIGISSILLYKGLWNTNTSILIIGSMFPIIGCFIGFTISAIMWHSWKRCRAIAMETGAQNMQVCGTVLQLFFTPHQLSQIMTLPVMYSCFQLITGLLLIIAYQIYKKKWNEQGQVEENACKGEINTAFEKDTCEAHKNAEDLHSTRL